MQLENLFRNGSFEVLSLRGHFQMRETFGTLMCIGGEKNITSGSIYDGGPNSQDHRKSSESNWALRLLPGPVFNCESLKANEMAVI